MSRKKLEEVVEWIVNGNLEEFKKDFDTVKKQFSDLSEEEISILKDIQINGLAEFDAEEEDDVVGQTCGRSYGW